MPGLNMTIELGDADRLMREFANHRSTLTSELRTAERDGLKALADEAKRGAAEFSTVLPQSVTYEVGGGGLAGIVGSQAKTARSIYEGRKPPDAPTYEALQRWLLNRGKTVSISTRRPVRHARTRLGRQLANEELRGLHDDAVIIQRIIRERGTKSLPFILPAARAAKSSVERLFSTAIERALRKLAGK